MFTQYEISGKYVLIDQIMGDDNDNDCDDAGGAAVSTILFTG